MDNGPFLIDTCYNYFEPFYGYDDYGEGIGSRRHYYNTCSVGNFYCEETEQLLFYRKGIDSCGLRPTIPLPSGFMEFDVDNYIKIYPNPFAIQTQIDFPEEQINSVILITNIMGEEVKRSIFSGRTYKLESEKLINGVYYFSILNKKIKLTKKLIVQH